MRATSQAPPETSIATRSVGSKLAANASSASGVIATRPAERTTPSSQIATSQKSRCRSRPIPRPIHLTNALRTTNHLPHELTHTGEAAGERHRPIRARGTIRASRRGGHRKARARSPSSKTACRLRSPRRPLSRITRPYARGRTEPPGPGFSCTRVGAVSEFAMSRRSLAGGSDTAVVANRAGSCMAAA